MTHHPATHDTTAMQALRAAGVVCGTCGNNPDTRTCPDCDRCYRNYLEALRAAGWAPRAETLTEAATALTNRGCSPESVSVVRQLVDGHLCIICDGHGRTLEDADDGGIVRRCRACRGQGISRIGTAPGVTVAH